MQSYSVLLLDNGDAIGPARYWAGGLGRYNIWANFEGSGGGSVSLEFLLPDGITWITVNDISGNPIDITGNDSHILFKLPPAQIRGTVVDVSPVRAQAERVNSHLPIVTVI